MQCDSFNVMISFIVSSVTVIFSMSLIVSRVILSMSFHFQCQIHCQHKCSGTITLAHHCCGWLVLAFVLLQL